MLLLEIWKGVLLVFLYIGAFVFFGALLPSKFHKNSITSLCLVGFMIYFTAFQTVALPMKLLKLPLKYLTLTWFGIMGGVFLAVLLFRRKVLLDGLKKIASGREKIICSILFILTAGVLALALGMNTNHISDFDAGYYIGLPVSSVYSNTIECMDPYSGQLLSSPDPFYLLNTNTIHCAVIFQALNIHPLVEEKFSMTAALVVVFCLFLYRGGQLLFEENRKKGLMFLWIALLSLLFSYSIAGTSHYFAYRTYEGKAVTAYLYMTAIFVFFIGIMKEKTEKWGWAGLLFAAGGGVAFCNTALFVIPVMITACVIPYILTTKKWDRLKAYFSVMLVCLIWICLYRMI